MWGGKGSRSKNSLTVPLYLGRLGGPLPRSALIPGVEDHVLVLQAVQLIGETLAGWLKLDLLQQDLLGRGSQEFVEVPLIARLLSSRF